MLPPGPNEFNMNSDTQYPSKEISNKLYEYIGDKKFEDATNLLSSSSRLDKDDKLLEVNYTHPDGSYTPLHRAVYLKAPFELIKLIVEIGSTESLRKIDSYGSTPLHSACTVGSPKEVVEFLINKSDIVLLTMTNNRGNTPLDNLISVGRRIADKVLMMVTKLYELNHDGQRIPETTRKNLLKWTHKLPQSSQDRLLKSPLIRVIVNDKFNQSGCLAILLMDIYVKAAITWVYSFVLPEILSGRSDTTLAIVVLSICFYWTASREISQISTTFLRQYILDPVNWFDQGQLIFLGLSLRTLAEFDGNLSSFHRVLFMIGTAVAWLQVLFVFGVLIKGIAIFAVALVKIAGKLGPFFFTTVIFLAMFSHVFILANSGVENMNCDSEDVNLVHWTCDISSSYIETFMLLLTGDLAYNNVSVGSERMTPSLIFGFFMTVLFLNISIAVITDAYNDAKSSESRAFTRNRLAFAAGSQSLVSVLVYQHFWKGLLCNRERIATSPRPEQSNLESNIENGQDRLSFEVFPDWKCLEESKGEDKQVLYWWFVSWGDHELPSLAVRLRVFFKRASLDEIFYPGDSFESLLMGVQRREKDKTSILLGLGARIMSYLLFIIFSVSLLVVFLAGSFTLGLLWPEKMRDLLFDEDIHEKDKKAEK